MNNVFHVIRKKKSCDRHCILRMSLWRILFLVDISVTHDVTTYCYVYKTWSLGCSDVTHKSEATGKQVVPERNGWHQLSQWTNADELDLLFWDVNELYSDTERTQPYWMAALIGLREDLNCVWLFSNIPLQNLCSLAMVCFIQRSVNTTALCRDIVSPIMGMFQAFASSQVWT